MPGYLSAEASNVEVLAGETATLPEITLIGGDVNGDNYIDAADLALIARNFGFVEWIPLPVVNPGAETGNTTGWATTGAFTAWRSGVEDYPESYEGNYFFHGGNAPLSTATQEIDISDYASLIDSGALLARTGVFMRVWEQTPRDEAWFTVEYLNGDGGVIETFSTGPTTDLVWTEYHDERVLPQGTRKIRIILKAVRNAGTANDGYFDAVSCKIKILSTDINGDGRVDIFDLVKVGIHFGERGPLPIASPFGGPAPVTGKELEGKIYFLPEDTQRLPDFSKLESVGTIYADCLNISPRSFTEGFPGVTKRFEWFGIVYEGEFGVEKGGEYEFCLRSDDGAKLYIDGQLVIDNDGIHSPMEKCGRITLSKGNHEIKVEYFQGPRYKIALQLFITPPGGQKQIFCVSKFPPVTKVVSGIYYRSYNPKTDALGEPILIWGTDAESLDWPSLTRDSKGNLYVVWAEKRGENWKAYHSVSTDGGQSWSSPSELGLKGVDNRTPRLRWSYYNFFSPEKIEVVWRAGDRLILGDLENSKSGVEVTGNATITSKPFLRDSSGKIHLVFGKNSHVWYTSSADGTSWSSPKQIDTFPNAVGGPRIALDSKGNLYVGYNFNVGAFLARSNNGGATWSSREILDGGWSNFDSMGDITIDGNDVIHVIYTACYGWADHPFNIFYRRSGDGGNSWSQPVQLTFEPNAHPKGDWDHSGYSCCSFEAGEDGRLFLLYRWNPTESRWTPTKYGESRKMPDAYYRLFFRIYNGNSWLEEKELSHPEKDTWTGDLLVEPERVHIVYLVKDRR